MTIEGMQVGSVKLKIGSSLDISRPRLRRAEACAYLASVHGVPIKPSTLATWATRGGGPAFQKSGPTPLYTPEELDRWALARLGRLRASTSDQG